MLFAWKPGQNVVKGIGFTTGVFRGLKLVQGASNIDSLMEGLDGLLSHYSYLTVVSVFTKSAFSSGLADLQS